MFERFNEEARQVVVLAQDEARRLKHNYIGTEHVLLGLLRAEDSLSAQVLAALDVTLEMTRADVARIVAEGDELATGQIPFTRRAKKVLEFALQEALSLGHNYVGSEHILLGLARENSGVGARVLADYGVNAERIRTEAIRMLSTTGRPKGSAGVGFAPVFALADFAIALEDAKQALIERQEFEKASQLRSQERRLHELIREIEGNLVRLGLALQPPSLRREAARWEYEVKTLEGGSDAWVSQLSIWRGEGWELRTVVTDGEKHRAILERRV